MKMKLLTPLFISLITAGAASAATIGYTFQTSGNITNAGGVNEAYSAPDTNDFGAGITVSSFTMADRDATEYSRFTSIGGGATNTQAALGHGGAALIASFTVTIDNTVTVDLTNIKFDTSLFWGNSGNANVVEQFSTVLGANPATNVTNANWTHNGGTNYQENPANNQSINLTGLTGLTDTTVTFRWSFSSDRSNTFATIASGLDDINLTGTIAAVPEPSTFALLGLGVAGLLIRRRR